MPTLASLRESVLIEADLQSGQVDDDVVDRYLNEELSELYEILVLAYDGVFSAEATFTLGAGESEESLPVDFYQATDLEDVTDAANPVSLDAFEYKDRNRIWGTATSFGKGWTIHGGQILIRPKESAPGNYNLVYVPSFQDLEEDDDTIEVPNHWELHAVLGAAIRLKNDQELSASGLEQRRDKLTQRIQNAARKRTGPRKVRDARAARGENTARFRDWLIT